MIKYNKKQLTRHIQNATINTGDDGDGKDEAQVSEVNTQNAIGAEHLG